MLPSPQRARLTPVGKPSPPLLPLHGMAWLKDGLEHAACMPVKKATRDIYLMRTATPPTGMKGPNKGESIVRGVARPTDDVHRGLSHGYDTASARPCSSQATPERGSAGGVLTNQRPPRVTHALHIHVHIPEWISGPRGDCAGAVGQLHYN